MVALREFPPILTIGYGNRSFEEFLALLHRHAVDLLVDVRSAPYSRARPSFRKAPLREALEARGIAYEWLGRALGGRPGDPSLYEAGRLVPERVRAQPSFREALRALQLERIAGRRVCLMCAELEPERCHRRSLLAPSLLDLGEEVLHVTPDGRLARQTAEPPRPPRQPLLFGAG